MAGVYAQTEIEWTRALSHDARPARRRVPVRRHLRQSAELRRRLATALVSPKLGAAFGPWAGTELYANAGMGFHSNDARGAVITRGSADR